MKKKVVDNNLVEAEVKRSFMEFYQYHKEECDKKYEESISENNLHIYEEIEDDDLVNQFLIKTDVVILTANVFEKNILHLNAVGDQDQKVYHCTINSCNNPRRPFNINIYFFKIGDFHILHMEARQTGSYSMGGSADLVRYILNSNYCYPSAIISYGICFGNDYNVQKIGDTIIVDKLYPYFMSAKVEEKFFFVKDSNIFNIDPELETRIKHLIGSGVLSKQKRIFYGSMVTGEAVISNDIMKDIFIKAATNQPVLGGEMEGYGLFKECQGFECLIPCMIVKAICDWGVCKNLDDDEVKRLNLKDKAQVYAADQAYKVMAVILKSNARVFESSIYEQIKELILLPRIKREVISLALLRRLFSENVRTPKKYCNIDDLHGIILQILIKDKILKKVGNGVYSIQGEK